MFPSTWEGFGNPTIESIAARRPCAAFPYPVLAEILSSGVRLFSTEAPENVVKFLAEPEDVRDRYYDVNLRRARLSYCARRPAAAAGRRCSRRTGGSHGERRPGPRPAGADRAMVGDREARRIRGAARGDRRVLPRPRRSTSRRGPSYAIVGGLVIACVVLPLPIVLGYGVRAAEREDRGR